MVQFQKYYLIWVLTFSIIFCQTQYLIICPEVLNETAQEMKNLHESLVEEEFQLNVEILHTETICSNCTNLKDVIEDTLISRLNDNLKYVLFLGDENTIPPQYYGDNASDDFYTKDINNSTIRPELAMGRIPVSTVEEANQVVAKIISYTLEPDMGAWRSKVLLFADDENKSGSSISYEIKHTQNSDNIFDSLTSTLSVIPLYGTDYIPTPGPNGLTHPELTSDIIQTINSGVSILNYIGHGDPQKLAGEAILDMNRDINYISPQGNQLPIWVVGTCSFGHYDNEDSFTEALLTKPDGAIAVIATTRSIGATQNYHFLEEFFNQIKDYVQTQTDNSRLGDIFYNTKKNINSTYNLYLFQLFGDPAQRLPFPKQNNTLITSVPNSLEVITQSKVEVGTVDSSFILVQGNDIEINREYEDTILLKYTLPGDIIFQGDFIDSAHFFVPLDAEVCEDCSANIMVYSANETSNQIDKEFSIPFLIPDDISIEDNEGPLITLYQNGNIIGSNATLFSPFNITISIEDESGINLMGVPGHQLTYTVGENEPTPFDQFFNYSNPASGIANITLTNIENGLYEFSVEAWDNVNNRTEISVSLNLNGSEDNSNEESSLFSVNNVFNVPNPCKKYTYFTFELSDVADVEIDVFTLSGVPIISFKENKNAGFNSLPWIEGLESIANGTYMYSFKATSETGFVESLHTLSILK